MNRMYFVDENSIVRKIWGKADTVLFIFAGAAAEFALNKAVDWLYFTGRLPKDPIGRLFSTVTYAKAIIFSEKHKALEAIDSMSSIHARVEADRGASIPDWAYRDVLFLLIDYSIRSYEILERKLTQEEKDEVYHVFNRVGIRMGLKGLPTTFNAWKTMRYEHLKQNLEYSTFTNDLFKQYRHHLGWLRYWVLREVQSLIVPEPVHNELKFRKFSLLYPLLAVYRISKRIKLDGLIKVLLLPADYKKRILALDIQ